jgi:hypothetical protein
VRDSLLLATALLASTCGMAWLALAMKAHWQQVCGDVVVSKVTKRVLRALGAAALITSLFLCFAADHGSIAVLVWVMSLGASALIVAFTLTWRPGLLAWTAPWMLRRRVAGAL